MKKIVLYTSISLSLVSISIYAIGLGDMKVISHLDQPFQAQIKLIDVGNTPLSGIKANIASVEDYQRMGLDRLNAVGTLNFVVEKDARGEPILRVFSSERISEPFMQVLVDLAWAEGQVYHSYTVLLDPPNYQLVSNKKLSGHIGSNHSRKQMSYRQNMHESSSAGQYHHVLYGPTTQGETVWQIAQRFKTDQNLLQQMILAIVGANPDAFNEGNLNGLKSEIRLQIPTSMIVSNVPANLAESEVLAHDKAWQTRQPIQHVIMPPYTERASTTSAPPNTTLTEKLSSNLPAVPVFLNSSKKEISFSNELAPTTSLVSIGEAFGIRSNPTNQQQVQQPLPKPINVKAEIDIAAAAIDSVHQANALLIEQMHTLLIENKRLQKQLSQKNNEISKLRKNMLQILERRGVAGQVNHLPVPKEQSSLGSLLLFLLLLGGGGGFVYWMFWIRPREFLKDDKSEDVHDSMNEPNETMSDLQEDHEDLSSRPSMEQTELIEPPMIEPSVIEQPFLEEQEVKDTLDEGISFEPITIETAPTLSIEEPETQDISVEDKPIELTKKAKSSRKTKPVKKQKETKSDDNLLEFEPGLLSPSTKNPEEELLEGLSEVTKPNELAKSSEDEHAMEFVINLEEEPVAEELAKPVKSSIALDTLLDLARTYMGMDDIESAKQSLQEVLEFGNERQKKESQELLDQLKRK